MLKCECPEIGNLDLEMIPFYNKTTELPYVKHNPGECKCTNDLAVYKRGEKTLILCSCCCLPEDEELFIKELN